MPGELNKIKRQTCWERQRQCYQWVCLTCGHCLFLEARVNQTFRGSAQSNHGAHITSGQTGGLTVRLRTRWQRGRRETKVPFVSGTKHTRSHVSLHEPQENWTRRFGNATSCGYCPVGVGPRETGSFSRPKAAAPTGLQQATTCAGKAMDGSRNAVFFYHIFHRFWILDLAGSGFASATQVILSSCGVT